MDLLTRALDLNLADVPAGARPHNHRVRIYLAISLACAAAYVPVNVALSMPASAWLCAAGVVVFGGLSMAELAHPSTPARPGVTIGALFSTFTLLNAIALAEVPTRSVTFFFDVLPLMAAVLLQGVGWVRRWAAVCIVEVWVAFGIEWWMKLGDASAMSIAGNAAGISLFVLFGYGVAVLVRRPLDREIQEHAETLERLAETNRSLSRALRAREEFLANVSHELRTPMNGVLGLSEVLDATPLSDEQRGLLRAIRQSGTGLLTLLNDVLDLAKYGTEGFELARAEVAIRDLVFDVVELSSLSAREKKLELVASIAPDVPLLVMGDAARLRQLLANLVGNAVKFTDHGEVDVRVERTTTDGTEGLSLRVRDTGIGLSDEQITRLFQPFSQATPETHQRFGGTGLGLSVCKRLAERMGGTIGVESKEGAGAVFSVWLPISGGAPPSKPAPRGRALVVARSSSLARTLGEILIGMGIEPDHRVAPLGDGPVSTPYDWCFVDEGLQLSDAELGALSASGIRRCVLITVDDRSASPPFAGTLRKPVRPDRVARCLDREAPEKAEGPARDAQLGMSVLVVEDNVINRMVVMRMLEQLGCSVAFAEDGSRAVSAVAERSFDVVLMDVHMPVMDGLESARLMRSAERGRRTTIIALTASVFPEDQQRCTDAGMDDFLVKPVQLKELRQMLGRWRTADAAR